jgi:transcriptional regulator with XRE-family HTH domain
MNELRKQLAEEFKDREYAHAYLEENSNMRIAAQVRALRLQSGLSQNEIANLARMKQERISKIESADFDSLTLKTLRRLAEAFDVHLAVKFESIHEAVSDFIELSTERLVCDRREQSLQKIVARASLADVASSANTIMTLQIPPVTSSNTALTRVGIKIKA